MCECVMWVSFRGYVFRIVICEMWKEKGAQENKKKKREHKKGSDSGAKCLNSNLFA